MGANPWHVESIQDFSFLNCPECTFKSKHEDFFQEHAVKSHPQSRVLFDENFEIDPLQEVKVATHGNVEYYVEVKKGDFHAKVNSKLMFLPYKLFSKTLLSYICLIHLLAKINQMSSLYNLAQNFSQFTKMKNKQIAKI